MRKQCILIYYFREGKGEKEREKPSICYSTHIWIHCLILVCALTGD